MILGSVLGGFWVGLGPGKSCQSVQLYAFSGFGLFWSGVCFRIRFWKGSGMHLGRFGCRLGHPSGACGLLFQRLGATFVACRFLVFFGWFPGPVKISSRAKVGGNYVESGALNSRTTDQQTTAEQQTLTGNWFQVIRELGISCRFPQPEAPDKQGPADFYLKTHFQSFRRSFFKIKTRRRPPRPATGVVLISTNTNDIFVKTRFFTIGLHMEDGDVIRL